MYIYMEVVQLVSEYSPQYTPLHMGRGDVYTDAPTGMYTTNMCTDAG